MLPKLWVSIKQSWYEQCLEEEAEEDAFVSPLAIQVSDHCQFEGPRENLLVDEQEMVIDDISGLTPVVPLAEKVCPEIDTWPNSGEALKMDWEHGKDDLEKVDLELTAEHEVAFREALWESGIGLESAGMRGEAPTGELEKQLESAKMLNCQTIATSVEVDTMGRAKDKPKRN